MTWENNSEVLSRGRYMLSARAKSRQEVTYTEDLCCGGAVPSNPSLQYLLYPEP